MHAPFVVCVVHHTTTICGKHHSLEERVESTVHRKHASKPRNDYRAQTRDRKDIL